VRMPVFRRTKGWFITISGLLLSSILFAACGENSPSILRTAGPIAAHESTLFWVILIISIIVFVGVEGALVFSIIRFRERPGTPNPRQLHGDLRLEVAWTVIPMIILFIILVFTIRGLLQVAPEAEPSSGPKVSVVAIGHQWWWEFYYPEWNITSADSLHIPVGTTVHVDLYSNNVIHSFWVPQLTGKTDVVPGHNNQKWFSADRAGTFLGICTEYCGTQHANMKFNVVAEDTNSFQTWVSTQQQAAVKPAAGGGQYNAAAGQQVFQNACTGCHGIVGVGNYKVTDPRQTCDDPSKACLVGPNLTHFGARDQIAGGVLSNNKDKCDPNDPNIYQNCHLAQWLKDPQAVKPGNDMVVSLGDKDIRNLVAYLESLT